MSHSRTDRATCRRQFPSSSVLALLLALAPPLAASPPFQDADQEIDAAPATDQQQDGEQDDSSVQADVVVTATRYKKSTFEIPLGVTVVDEQELTERVPATPADALRYKPGIWVQNAGNTRGTLVLRGFLGPRVLTMFDGIRRNTAGLFGGPSWFLQNVDALDVDRIEVIRGPGSVLYGSDAIGGVVNVITNEEPAYTPETAVGGRSILTYDSASQGVSGRLEAHVSGPKMYAFVGGTRRDIGDLTAGGDIGKQRPSNWHERNWDGQVNYLLDDGSELEVFVQEFSRPRNKRFDAPQWRQQDSRELLGVNWYLPELGPMADVKITAYSQDQEFFIDEQFWDSNRDEETTGFELQATAQPREDVHVVYGTHIHVDHLRSNNPQAGTADPEVDWTNPAVFALSEWQASDRLRLDLGLRWDSFGLDSKAPPTSQLATPIQNAITAGSFAASDLELNTSDSALTGGVGLVYALNENLNLVGHVGRAFRAPNKSDMLQFGQFTFGFKVPSPDLQPESSWTSEVGLRAQYEGFAGALTLFRTEIQDGIVTTPGTFNGSSWIDVNGNGTQDPTESVFVADNSSSEIVAQGVEIEARQYLPETWAGDLGGSGALSWYGNASWIYGKDRGNDEPLDRAYPVNALLGIRWEDDRDTEETTSWFELETWLVRQFDRIPSTRQSTDPAFFDNPQDPTSGPLRADGSVPGFSIFNLRGGWKLNPGTTLSVALENVFDRSYRVKDSRIDGPGRSLVLGLRARF